MHLPTAPYLDQVARWPGNGRVILAHYDEESVVVETEMGMLEVKGVELHVNQLNLENGELSLTGDISSVEYDDKLAYGKGGASIISRLFG